MSRWASGAAGVLVVVVLAAGPTIAQTPPARPDEVPVQELTLPVLDLELPVSSLGDTVEVRRSGVTLRADILFAFGSARLASRARSRISAAVEEIRRRDPERLVVEGHTDDKGSPAYNLQLSRRRADAVRRVLLAQLGGDAPAMRTVGRGEAEPVANNRTNGRDDPRGRARNRRVEIRFG